MATKRAAAHDETAREPDEVWGWLLIVVGALAVLAIHFNLLGPAGIGVRREGAAGLGWGLDVLPLGLLVAGGTLVVGRARRGAAGAIAALAALAVAAAGLGDLAGGHPGTGSAAHILGGAGGYVGAEIGGGLRSLIGAAGAGIVLGAVAFVAVCACCAASVRQGVTGIWHALRATGGAVSRFFTVAETGETAPEDVAAPDRAPAKQTPLVDWPLDEADAIAVEPLDELASLVTKTRTGRHTPPPEDGGEAD
jgi:hypothetical protein